MKFTALTVFLTPKPSEITPEKLKKYSFTPIDNTPEVKSFGWTNLDDMMDTAWEKSGPEKGGYLCFSLRVDTRKVPAAVLKKHLDAAIAEEEASTGRHVPKDRKKDLKELHTAKLLFSKTEPVPSTTDIAVGLASGLVFVGSASTSVCTMVQELFQLTFGQTLTYLDAPDVQDILRQLYADPMDIATLDKDYALGMAENGQITLSREDGAGIIAKTATEYAQQGIDDGLLIAKLHLRATREGDESQDWTFSLSNGLTFSGLKTPKVVEDRDDPDGAVLEKLYLLEQVVAVVRKAFGC